MAQSGYTPIILFNSGTASNTPTTGNLAVGELAINYADGKLYYNTGSAIKVLAGAGGAGIAGGSNTQVQYNSSGNLAGSANMTFNGTSLTLANDASISTLTVGLGTTSGGSTNAISTVLGYQALSSNTSGQYNIAVGYQSLKANTTGQGNVGVAVQALLNNTSGNYNTVVGSGVPGVSGSALSSNTTGSYNSAFGNTALLNNTTGQYNTSVGGGALQANTTASYNTAIGYQAGYTNSTGTRLVAVGPNSLYGNTTGTDNVAIGSFGSGLSATLGSNTTGSYNTALGGSALGNNTTASNNTAVGFQALYANSTGSVNTAVGYQALYSNTTGVDNTVFGYQAGYYATGNDGCFIGYQAGYNQTSGSQNTYIGVSAGVNMTTGRANTILGRFSGNAGGLDIRTASNFIVLSDGDGNPRGFFDNGGNLYIGSLNGSAITPSQGVTCFNQYNVGQGVVAIGHASGVASGLQYVNFVYNSSAIGSITQSGTTAVLYNTTSDQRLKENIVDAPEFGSVIDSIQVRSYDWKADHTHQRAGFIAQELVTVAPEAVHQPKDSEEMMAVDYSKLVPMLVKEIQSLRKRLAALEAK